MKILATSTLALLAAALMCTTANAAETVIGGGAAEACYRAAEFGFKPADNIATCNLALRDVMQPRDRAATLINRGILKLALNDARGSLNDFDSGLAINAGLGEGYVNRGASLILMERYTEALTAINKGLSMGAKKPQIAYFDRGMANEGLGNLPAAYADYKQAQLIDPYFDQPTQELKRFRVVTKPAGT